MLSYYPAVIIFAPLAAGLLVGLMGRGAGLKAGRIGVAAEVLAFALSVVLLYDVTTAGPQTLHLSPWTDGILQLTLHIDRLSAVMLVHIAAISTLIHFFSVRYMQQERGYARFHSLLAFTTFVLFGMVASANLLMLLMFWQLLSWLVPLLSHNYAHPPTVHGAFRTFVMQRVGDVAFLGAVVLAYSSYGTLDLQELFVRAAVVEAPIHLWPGGFQVHAATAVTLLIFIGAMSKSTQFPLHMWLPDALYAPTPVTAFLHAGIINAGGFLLARLAPLYVLSPPTLHWVFAVGLLTALLGSSMMLVQNDIKKTLGYSTIGQMGFMIMECGLGAFGLAIFHLIAHGIFKGTIFLNCGYVIHAARQEPNSPPRRDEAVARGEFSSLTWLTGLGTTLILPLIIVLAAHGILNIPLRDSQGTVIFLFFGWATSSQAILTLYRLRAVASWKVAASMLSTLFVVVLTYLLAAESFTHFLFPTPGEVAAQFRAGALPVVFFDLLIAAFALIIIFGWFLIYARSHGRTIRTPRWVTALQVRIYLLLINRLYLDAVSARLQALFTRAIDRLDASRSFPFAAGFAAVGTALTTAERLPDFTPEIVLFLLFALLLPLFPLHGLYVRALTRPQGYLGAALALLLPAAGAFGIAPLLPHQPAEFLRAVGVLALFGTLYGSLKALAQTRVPDLLAYAGLALFSALWWHLAFAQTFTGPSALYGVALALLTAGLLVAWQGVRRRYGDLDLRRMHGLARPMPRFAVVMSLLIMAAVGLPPFGLFSAYAVMLLQPFVAISWELAVILLTWLLASWYLFRMMQRLLFGAPRADIPYDDLRPGEVASCALVLVILALLGALPPEWLDSNLAIDGSLTAMEILQWHK